MLSIEDTKLEVIGFGDEPSDNFYILVDTIKSPGGIDMEKLQLSDPRNFDSVLDDMGCIVMLSGNELEELIKRGKVNDSDLHKELYNLAVNEGIIQK
mgnify:CR=1 FL=1